MKCPKCKAELYSRQIASDDHSVVASELFCGSGHSFVMSAVGVVDRFAVERPLAPDEIAESNAKRAKWGTFRCGHARLPRLHGKCAICAHQAMLTPRRSRSKVFA